MQEETQQDVNHLKRALEEKEIEADALSDRLETKEAMLNDQAHQIQQLKKEIQKLLDEIQHVQDSKHQQKDYYEELLQKEIEEAEQSKSQLKTVSQENQDLDHEFENLRALYD